MFLHNIISSTYMTELFLVLSLGKDKHVSPFLVFIEAFFAANCDQWRNKLSKCVWEGAHIHIFMFKDHKNNRFQKKLTMQNKNIWTYNPLPIIEFGTSFACNAVLPYADKR